MDERYNSIISKLINKYKNKCQNNRKFIGIILASNPCDNVRLEIVLSRSYIRDKALRNQGYNYFDHEAYFLNVSKTLLTLQDYDYDKIPIDIHSIADHERFHLLNDEIISESEESNDNNEIDHANSEISDMMSLMAEMGLPSQFGMSKMNRNKNKNSKNVQINDMRLIFQRIKNEILFLLNDPNKLISIWVNSIQQNVGKYSEFIIDLLSNSVDLNDANKSHLESLIVKISNTDNGVLETEIDLIESFKRVIFFYTKQKSIEWISELPISDKYKSCSQVECSGYLQKLLNSIGLSIELHHGLEKWNLYPIIPESSIKYSQRNDLSLLSTNYKVDNVNELYKGNDEENPMNKYYFQRYRYFNRFDEGILLDEESWYSVTPGVVAEQLAIKFRDVFLDYKSPIIVDAFCGAGGNSIRFAERGFIVLAIDMDPIKLKLLMQNASIYQVEKRIIPVCCDFFKISDWILQNDSPQKLKSLFTNVLAVHMSPPWGGPEYLNDFVFDVDNMDFKLLIDTAMGLSQNISCFIPRHSNCDQIIHWLTLNGQCTCIEIQQNCVQNKIKALSLFTGVLVQAPDLALM